MAWDRMRGSPPAHLKVQPLRPCTSPTKLTYSCSTSMHYAVKPPSGRVRQHPVQHLMSSHRLNMVSNHEPKSGLSAIAAICVPRHWPCFPYPPIILRLIQPPAVATSVSMVCRTLSCHLSRCSGYFATTTLDATGSRPGEIKSLYGRNPNSSEIIHATVTITNIEDHAAPTLSERVSPGRNVSLNPLLRVMVPVAWYGGSLLSASSCRFQSSVVNFLLFLKNAQVIVAYRR